MNTSNPYHTLVHDFENLLHRGRAYPLGGFPPPALPPVDPQAPVMLLLSPHPDDECINGGIALRARADHGWRVVNVAVTLGSNRERQLARAEELRRACDYLGFELVMTGERGLEHVNPDTRSNDTSAWNQKVGVIADILTKYSPNIIVFPHENDWNSTHVGTHYLAMDALHRLRPSFSCRILETEYWAAMKNPTTMVELSAEHVSSMVSALSFHAGELRRNPYHLSLPAWLIDNVRRGSELVGGQGEAAPDCTFATLYRLQTYENGTLASLFETGRHISRQDSLEILLAH